MVLLIIKDVLSVIGAITTIIGLYELFRKIQNWLEKRKELRRKIALLESSGYFIAHIIHLGGEFSMTHSLRVYSNEEGGYYFNPPKDFVSVVFNRSGDSLVIMPTELAKKYGFVINSVAGEDQVFKNVSNFDICHLPQTSLKNENFVRFSKKQT